MKRIPVDPNETKLERAARVWLNRTGEDYESGVKGALEDLFQGGCQSGMVSNLVYYTDTLKFYRRHKADIHTLLKDMMEDVGDGPASLFGDKWDKDDPLADDTSNQNLLAWFGFEEAARIVASRADIEI